jgi:uncharacterized delta-60 repeat protein
MSLRCLLNGIRSLCGFALFLMPIVATAQQSGSFDTAGFAAPDGFLASVPVGGGNVAAEAMAIQPDGKIVLLGSCFDGAFEGLCLVRLNANGTLDASFDGPDLLNPGNGAFRFGIPGTAYSNAGDVKIQADGKIIIAGSCGLNGVAMCFARLHANGSFDDTFDGPDAANPGNGAFAFKIDPAGVNFAYAIQIQLDGKIIVLGSCGGANRDFCLARMNFDGSFDENFDGDGLNGNGRFLLAVGNASDIGRVMAIQSDGKILVAGQCMQTNLDFCAARLLPNGMLDSTFDGPDTNNPGNGKFLLDIAGNDYVDAVLIQPDAKIVLAGTCTNSDFDFCAVRLTSLGQLDTTFDGPSGVGNGKVVISVSASSDLVSSARLQSDGKLVLAGRCANGTNNDFCVVRLDADGTLDTTLERGSASGRILIPLGSANDAASSIALQNDGKILLSGMCRTGTTDRFCATRLLGGPFGARACSPDVDGDGVLSATVDGLILTRIMLGLRGDTVLSGITIPANAPRNNWDSVRDFLSTHCMMQVN